MGRQIKDGKWQDDDVEIAQISMLNGIMCILEDVGWHTDGKEGMKIEDLLYLEHRDFA